jgi:hypothetical protein
MTGIVVVAAIIGLVVGYMFLAVGPGKLTTVTTTTIGNTETTTIGNTETTTIVSTSSLSGSVTTITFTQTTGGGTQTETRTITQGSTSTQMSTSTTTTWYYPALFGVLGYGAFSSNNSASITLIALTYANVQVTVSISGQSLATSYLCQNSPMPNPGQTMVCTSSGFSPAIQKSQYYTLDVTAQSHGSLQTFLSQSFDQTFTAS